MKLYFDPLTEVVVTGQDPEMADVSNPRGERLGFAAVVRASNERGDTWELPLGTFAMEGEAYDRADVLARALTARMDNMGKPPVGFSSWRVGRPVYGSEAYLEYGMADDLAWEQGQDD